MHPNPSQSISSPLFAGLLLLGFAAGLSAHDVDLPEWVRQGRACIVDLREAQGSLALELSFRDPDAAVLSAPLDPATAAGAAALQARLAASVRVNGARPARLEPLSRSAKLGYLRWMAHWDGPLPDQIRLDAPVFEQGGWIQVFDFLPGAEDAGERSWFFESGQAFAWPQNRAAGPVPVWGRFFRLGFHHIVPAGWDHLLFVLGLCLGAAGLGALLGQVTAFTLAHSLTLALVAGGKLSLSPGVVEPLIALSIAWIAVENRWLKPSGARRWALVFGFGLVHGLGFAGALAETGIPVDAFWPALLSFNGGVEAGQLAGVAVFLAVFWKLRKRRDFKKKWVFPWSSGLAGLGILIFLLRLADV